MDDLFNINPKVSTAICAIIGFVLTDNLSGLEQEVLGNWIILIGQTIIANGTSQALIESRIAGSNYNINSKCNKSKYNPLFYDIEFARNILHDEFSNVDSSVWEEIMCKLKKMEEMFTDFKK